MENYQVKGYDTDSGHVVRLSDGSLLSGEKVKDGPSWVLGNRNMQCLY